MEVVPVGRYIQVMSMIDNMTVLMDQADVNLFLGLEQQGVFYKQATGFWLASMQTHYQAVELEWHRSRRMMMRKKPIATSRPSRPSARPRLWFGSTLKEGSLLETTRDNDFSLTINEYRFRFLMAIIPGAC